MNIEYLTKLRDSPEQYPGDLDNKFAIQPIPLSEIQILEQTWNNGSPFPKALRELLFLAGKDCYVLTYGSNETQQEMQENARSWLIDYNRTISRPFYVIDVYIPGDQFLFVYLDEGDNPMVHGAFLPQRQYEDVTWLHSLKRTLSEFINFRLDKVKKGYSPF